MARLSGALEPPTAPSGKPRSQLEEVRDVDLKTAVREAWQNKCNTLLGFLACVIAVTIVAVAQSAFEYTPLFFLSVAEFNVGEVDIQVRAASWTDYDTLNYSRIVREIGSDPKDPSLNYSTARWQKRANVWSVSSCNRSAIDARDLSERYKGKVGDTTCSAYVPACLDQHCNPSAGVNLYVIDSLAEKRMGLGKSWKMEEPIPKGGTLLQEGIATLLQVEVGDPIILGVKLPEYLHSASPQMASSNAFFLLLSSVAGIIKDGESGGKLSEEETQGALVEAGPFFASLGDQGDPRLITDLVKQDLERANPHDFAQKVLFNLPPPRIQAYLSNDYNQVKARVLDFATRLVARLGFQSVETKIMLLDELSTLRFLAMFLGLIVSLIVVCLSSLLCLLIYTLLLVSVEQRGFSLGVLRMLGASRKSIIRLILMQTLVTSIPAFFVGIIAAHFLNAFVLSTIADLIRIKLDFSLKPSAIFYAACMGLLVPILAAILPIRKALSSTLNDALDVTRNKVNAVEVSIQRSTGQRTPPALVALGALVAGFGTLIYYFFPRALLDGDLNLLLFIFLGLLLSMILGLTVLSLNFERPLEHALTAVLLWWTPEAVRKTMHKNLVAHRTRNRKTTLMYASSLAFILFVIVTFALQMITFQFQWEQRYGTGLRMQCSFYSSMNLIETLSSVDDILLPQERPSTPPPPPAPGEPEEEEEEWSDLPPVEDVAYVTYNLGDILGQRSFINTLGRIMYAGADVYAVSPNYDQVVLPGFEQINSRAPPANSEDSFSITEQLYTPRGSQSLVIGSLYKDNMALTLNSTLLLHTEGSNQAPIFRRLRPLAFLDGLAGFNFSPFPNRPWQDALVSVPTLVRLSRGKIKSVNDVPVKYIMFRLRRGMGPQERERVKIRLKSMAGRNSCIVNDVEDRLTGFKTALAFLDLIAGATTSIALLVSFFSLTSSMFTNIHEQGKEIGLLRAVGVTRPWIAAVYSLEATVLVLSAGVLGVCIGSAVAFTVTAQRSLFTQLPLPFVFPRMAVAVILIASVVSAFIAAFVPAIRLVHSNIVRLMRFS